ncbi:MAG TPA: serine/threonine protein kinase [Cyanobacteria bacterium UBA12227]|nr:serine/threonine protein kinase [Cyanobacteria bacterium UBA12227]HAX84714.1 serine/threonine protein kinase [Cyanobacteria bacterium UBA11370]HBY78239.1 serine/threonine protein kinase [Cyanobacteria bacterium UBA11148]
MAWLAGQKLQGNKYTLERELKRGHFGITYLASDRQKKRLVIKTLSDELLNQLSPTEIDKLQEKFLQEAVQLAKCRHPHIVQIKEPFMQGQQVCIAMDYVDGVDLANPAQKPLPEAEALRYIQQIGEALKGVHEAGLVHRDVKPANIIVRSGKSEAVLIDFGLARGLDNPLTTVNSNTADGFDALEVYHVDAQLGAYTDVYSLAATLYFLVTGQEPPTAIDRSLSKVRLIPAKQINSQISDRTNEVILIGMALAVEDRPQTMQEWLDILGVKRKTSLPWRNWNLIRSLVVIATVVGILGIIAAWTVFKPSSPPPEPANTPTSHRQLGSN